MDKEVKRYTILQAANKYKVSKQAVCKYIKIEGIGTFNGYQITLSKKEFDSLHFRRPNKIKNE